MTTAEYPLPAQQNGGAARKAEGFATPQQDKKPQSAKILPKRVLPIIFLPGIMGSNLRMSSKRKHQLEELLHKKIENIAWRPDSLGVTNIKSAANARPQIRQLQLDPLETTVDIYNPSGPPDISGDGRHSNVELHEKFSSPVLADDPPTSKNRRTAAQKGRERGWGEVYFGSYGTVLQILESRLNNTFVDGKIRPEWREVIGTDPSIWGSDPSLPQQALTEEELKKIATGCWFAVYAFGYNWLQSNGRSAKNIAVRIRKVINDLSKSGYTCKQVIVVTHSMGGLVGRALIHPDCGNLQDEVLGMVHGVMPAIGAPAAYKRIRAGFEDCGLSNGIKESIGAKVAGNFGDEVTAVLANSPGGLQLLPSESYGNGWLRVTHNGHDLEALPRHGDPYNEIYKIRNRWYALLREEWINPARLDEEHGGGTFKRTCDYLDKSQQFHQMIADTFHSNSFAHYGIDTERRSFGEVVWEIGKNCADPSGWQNWPILTDTKQGKLELVRWEVENTDKAFVPKVGAARNESIYATIRAARAPGDQTVPARSADYQLESKKFRGIFRQTGYEHQSSYESRAAVASTLYSIIRIAERAKW